MKDELLQLEKKLFKYEYISNKEWLNKVLHDNFKECGKSGVFFSKKGTIDFLLSCAEDRKIDIYNFECENIDNNTWIVHYITTMNNDKYFRTSIWVMDNNLKLLFHQASKLNLEIELIKF